MLVTRRPFAALATALVLLGAACGTETEVPPAATGGVDDATSSTTAPSAEAGPALTITSPSSGATIGGNVVTLDLAVEDFSVVPADGDTSGETGHFHVFVDGEPPPEGETIARTPGIIHSAEDEVTLYGMTPGEHRIAVVLGDGAHRRIHEDVQEEVTVTVAGPSVNATAPATATAGEPVTLDIAVDGFSLVPADGDTSGTTGHLHVFVDREPPPAGQPIPVEPGIIHTTEQRVTLSDLAAGEHTVWVVAGNGAHMPLEPMVADRVTFTVQ